MTTTELAEAAANVINGLAKLNVKSTNKLSSDYWGKTKESAAQLINDTAKNHNWNVKKVEWGKDRQVSKDLNKVRAVTVKSDDGADVVNLLSQHGAGNCDEKGAFAYITMTGNPHLTASKKKKERWGVRLCNLTTADHVFAIVACEEVLDKLGVDPGEISMNEFCDLDNNCPPPLVLDGWTDDWWFYYPKGVSKSSIKVLFKTKKHKRGINMFANNPVKRAEIKYARNIIRAGKLKFRYLDRMPKADENIDYGDDAAAMLNDDYWMSSADNPK